jgi:transcriptional regulator with XRE-family HTH domain
MEIYFDKIKFYRKKQKLSDDELSRAIGISRGTYWRWEKGLTKLSEERVCHTANILKVDVSKISNISPRSDSTQKNISEAANVWKELIKDDRQIHDQKIQEIIYKLMNLNNSLNNITLFVNGLLKTSDIAFYAKDTN